MAAEYIVSSGNPNVILCERGIRTFETYTRNTIDLAAVPLVHHLSHLPVIVDPSHATGKRWLVAPLAIGGVAVGADGVMVEVHPDPDEALSDAEQQLDPRPVPGDDGRARPGPRARPLDVRRRRSWPVAAAVGAVRPARRSTDAPDRDDADVDRRAPSRRPRGCAASSTLPGDKSISHRALMLATLAAGESRITRRRRRRRRPLDRRRSAGRSGATVERLDGRPAGRAADDVDYRVVSPGVDGLARARGRPRLRQLRDEPPAVRRDPRRAALPERPRRRRFVATATGRPYHRTASRDGRDAPRPLRRFPPAADRHRSPAPSRRRSMDPGPERAGEVGDPAGGAPGGGPDDGPRGGRDARPHRADAAGAGHRGQDGATGAGRRRRARRGSGGQSRRRADDDGDRRARPGRRVGGRLLARRRARSIRTPT